MKHGVSTYSFCSYLDSGRMSLLDAIQKAAELGFEGVELANLTGSYPFDTAALRGAAQEAGVKLCAWATSSDFALDPGEQLKHLKSEIDLAHAVGAEVLRTDIYHAELVKEPFREPVLEAIRAAADWAGERGLCLVTENHGGYLYSPERLEAFIARVDHPNFGLLCDIGNFASEDEDPANALRMLKHHVRHVHLKDAHMLDGDRLFPGDGWYLTRGGNYWRCAITGQGNQPLNKCIKQLMDAGYDGWLIQEFEGLEDCVYAVQKGLGYTKRLLDAAQSGFWREGL